MAPRRTSARNTSATPARDVSPTLQSARAGSAIPLDGSVRKRATRGASKQPGVAAGTVTNPDLPDVQIAQSYAYGSTKTPMLPDQLVASESMTLKQMAETLDAGMRKAEQQFEEHRAEVVGTLDSQSKAEARAERAQRAVRRASRESSSNPSREGSVDSIDSESRRTRRVAAWASGLESKQLRNIPEEEPLTPEKDVDNTDERSTRHGSEPSSFPSGIFDHSYNYERGLRGAAGTSRQRGKIMHFIHSTSDSFAEYRRKAAARMRKLAVRTALFLHNLAYSVLQSISRLWRWFLDSRLALSILALTLASVIALVSIVLFCNVYTAFLCTATESSFVHQRLQSFCGECRSSVIVPADLTLDGSGDVANRVKILQKIDRQIREIESRMDSTAEARYSGLKSLLEDLDHQHQDMKIKLSNIENTQPRGEAEAPLMQKVNYFARGTGALINPHRTSPTKRKEFSFPLRASFWLLGSSLSKYETQSPSSALEPWEDIGDCWCASSTGGAVHLGVIMGHSIYPTEIVIEHYPSAGSVAPDTTPKDIEVWADFGHLSRKEWGEYGVRELQGPNPIEPTMALIGTGRYDGTPGTNHVQTFRLNVNQHAMQLHTSDLTLRVLSNHGASHTCLYRVRVHGVPVVPHPKVQGTSGNHNEI